MAEEYLAVLADNPDERPALLKEIQAELAALLHQPHVEPAIRALADALMCLETLSYDQVFNVLRPVFEGLRVALPPRVRPYGSCAPRPLDMPAGTAVWDVYDAEAGVRRTATDSGGNSVLVVANGPAAAAAPL